MDNPSQPNSQEFVYPNSTLNDNGYPHRFMTQGVEFVAVTPPRQSFPGNAFVTPPQGSFPLSGNPSAPSSVSEWARQSSSAPLDPYHASTTSY